MFYGPSFPNGSTYVTHTFSTAGSTQLRQATDLLPNSTGTTAIMSNVLAQRTRFHGLNISRAILHTIELKILCRSVTGFKLSPTSRLRQRKSIISQKGKEKKEKE
jgi:hypothetical protein